MKFNFEWFNDLFKDINLSQIINPIIYIFFAIIFYILLSKIVNLFFNRNKEKLIEKQMQRVITLKAMTMSVIKYVIFFVVVIAIMANFGIDVSSLIAGLGIAGAILGLAFQDLVKDIIAGFSIITEGQYEVGDLIEIGDFKGRVTSVGLKTTRIRDYRGKVKIISNRNISELINWSRHDTVAEVKVNASYENDPDIVLDALMKMKKELDFSMEEMTDEIKILPMSDFAEDGITYTIQCKCKSYKHYAVQRAIRHEIYKVFKANKIEIPYRQVKVHSTK